MTFGPDRFPATSRYNGIETATLTGDDGTPIVYLRRRIVPPPDRFMVIQVHLMKPGDRLDLLAAQFFGDPQQFWRICDANAVIDPDELSQSPGMRVRITLPEGIVGQRFG